MESVAWDMMQTVAIFMCQNGPIFAQPQVLGKAHLFYEQLPHWRLFDNIKVGSNMTKLSTVKYIR